MKYTAVYVLWLLVLFLVPLSIVVLFSFLEPRVHGGVLWSLSLKSYSYLPQYLKLIWRSVWIAGISTILTLILAIPVAFYISKSRYKNFLLLLVVVPFWTNSLIRIYAWRVILGNNGVINQLLVKLGLEPVQFLYNPFAVILVIVYTYLPFAILPLFSSMEKVDESILEAALDLGANKREVFVKVLIPNVKAGLLSAFVFVFIPALGSYAIPDLVGGLNSKMIGNEIARQLLIVKNWPVASAMSNLLIAISLVGILLIMRREKMK